MRVSAQASLLISIHTKVAAEQSSLSNCANDCQISVHENSYLAPRAVQQLQRQELLSGFYTLRDDSQMEACASVNHGVDNSEIVIAGTQIAHRPLRVRLHGIEATGLTGPTWREWITREEVVDAALSHAGLSLQGSPVYR